MQIFTDLISFLKTLSFIDIIFFFAVLALMLLVIVLIYFIKENSEDNVDSDKAMYENLTKQEKSELDNLIEITKAIEDAEPEQIDLNKYENEQEEKAIISYDELLQKKNDFALNYSEEENLSDNITIKKVDLHNMVNKDIPIKPEIKVSVISTYEKEEAFLEALKTLQQKLN